MPHPHKAKLDRLSLQPAATISTLAAHTALSLGSRVPTQNFQAALYQGALDARGIAVGEVLALYVSDADLTQAEVEACIEAVPTNERDNVPLEASRRPVQLLGVITREQPLHLDTGNRLPKYREDIGLEFWIYNPSNAGMTTGAVASGQVWIYGRFVD